MTRAERDRLRDLASNATPGPWETRCRELSNYAPREVWTEFGWLDQLPRIYREPSYEYVAAANPTTVLKLLDALDVAEEALEYYGDSASYEERETLSGPRGPGVLKERGYKARAALAKIRGEG